MEKQLVELLLNQNSDYRLWEESFFKVCADYLGSKENWDDLLVTCRVYPEKVQAKTEYLVHVFRHETGQQKFDPSKLRFEGASALDTAFWDKDYKQGFDSRYEKLAMRFGLQRGMMLDRFHQFMTTGMN